MITCQTLLKRIQAQTPPSPPLKLTTSEIETIITDAAKNQYVINRPHHPYPISLLTQFLSMGTTRSRAHTDLDPILGEKDPRIEDAFIACAKKAQHHAHDVKTHAAIFGLSANPPTRDHGQYIRSLLTRYDRVHVIVNAQSPLKSETELVNAEARFEMMRIMLHAEGIDFTRCRLERIEIDRDPPSRMIATLSLLILMYPQTSWSLILGADAFDQFTAWYRWEDFKSLCQIVCYPRPGYPFPHHTYQTLENLGFQVYAPHLQDDAIASLYTHGSSTLLRNAYHQNHFTHIEALIHPEVHAFIQRHGYYGASKK